MSDYLSHDDTVAAPPAAPDPAPDPAPVAPLPDPAQTPEVSPAGPSEPPPTAAPPPPSGAGQAVDLAIFEWLNTRVRNSPISADTDSWNHLLRELPALRRLILKEL